jgi:hypothetical protein
VEAEAQLRKEGRGGYLPAKYAKRREKVGFDLLLHLQQKIESKSDSEFDSFRVV